MASNGIVEGLDVLKNKFISVVKVCDFKAIEPFPFYQSVKRFNTGVLPGTSLP
jgi:hypothetical protein